MAEPIRNTPGDPNADRKKMMRVLIPAGAIALVVVLVAVIASLSGGGGGRAMSDGSDGTADDPGLKEITSGVKYRDLREGQGDACPPGAKVKIHYTGWLTDGTVFDSSKDRGSPADFELEGLIQGWQIGIPGMKPGGIRKLVIAPDKAYGNQMKGKIPPNSTLIFEVELLEASGPRPRRSPAPDLNRLFDNTAPNAEDSAMKAIGTSGLKYRDLKEGDGAIVRPGATVLVDYIGWRFSDNKMFDSSWKDGGRPFTASLAGGVIRGWGEGLVGMKVGGIRKLVIPPELAYGARGAGSDIPPNATLVFEVELLAIK